MNLAIITSNMLFRESLKGLLENYEFRNGKSIIVKDFILENFEDLDVIVSDYQFNKLKEFLSIAKMKKNKFKEIEKIFITKKEFELLPKANIQLKRPFRILELVEALQIMSEKLKTKIVNKIFYT